MTLNYHYNLLFSYRYMPSRVCIEPVSQETRTSAVTIFKARLIYDPVRWGSARRSHSVTLQSTTIK